jgi:hypothetical protein
MQTFMKARERSRRVSIRILQVLFDYFQVEAKRFDMKTGELMAAILEVHQFKDPDRQSILLAVDAAEAKKKKKGRATPRRKSSS